MIDFSQVADIKINGLGVKGIFYHRTKDATNYNHWFRPYAYPLTVIGIKFNINTNDRFELVNVKDKYGCVVGIYAGNIQGKDLDNLSRAEKLIYSELNYISQYIYKGIAISSSSVKPSRLLTPSNVLELSAYCLKNETEYQDFLLTLHNQIKGVITWNDTRIAINKYLMSGTDWEITGWGNVLLDNNTDFSNETLFTDKTLVWATSIIEPITTKVDVATPNGDGSATYILQHEPNPNCYFVDESYSTTFNKYIFKLDEKVRIINTTTPLITLSKTNGATTTIASSRNDFSDYISKYNELTEGKYKREDYPYLVGVQQLRIKNPSLGINYGARFPVLFIADR